MTVYERAKELLDQNPNEKVKVIKILKEEYGLELAEAKEVVDKVNIGIVYEGDSILQRDVRTSQCEMAGTEFAVQVPSSVEVSSVRINTKESGELLNDYRRIKRVVVELLDRQSNLNALANVLKQKMDEEDKISKKNGIVGNIFWTISILIFFTGFTGGLFGIIFGLIIAVIVAFIGEKIDAAIVKDKYKIKAEVYHNQEVVPLIEQAQIIKNNIDEIWETEEMQLYERTIPEEYRQLSALDYFIRALETGRASNQKELFNLYEEEAHRRRMESLQSEILDTQQKQLDVSKEQSDKLDAIQKSQKHISKQVKYGNTVSTLDFLFKK